jgi:hypothetical protein
VKERKRGKKEKKKGREGGRRKEGRKERKKEIQVSSTPDLWRMFRPTSLW